MIIYSSVYHFLYDLCYKQVCLKGNMYRHISVFRKRKPKRQIPRAPEHALQCLRPRPLSSRIRETHIRPWHWQRIQTSWSFRTDPGWNVQNDLEYFGQILRAEAQSSLGPLGQQYVHLRPVVATISL